MDPSVREQTAMHIVVTYCKLLEVKKQLIDETLIRAIAAQCRIPPDETGAILTAFNMQKKELEDRLRTQVSQLATMLRQRA